MRPELYLKLGALREAAEAAFSLKNVNMLKKIRDQSKNSSFVQEVNQMIMQVGE